MAEKTAPAAPRRRGRCCTQFGRLAMMYYPERAYSRALRLFRTELEQTRGLMNALRGAGYRDNQRMLSPRQVKVIERFLGKP